MSCLSRDFLDNDNGAGLDTELDDVMDFDMEPAEDMVEASESFLRGWATADVVALRE